MKIVFSRKGFDSTNADIPSVFVRGGAMTSFPIPHISHDAEQPERYYHDRDLSGYGDICDADGVLLRERIRQLREKKKTPFEHECCHHDPDLQRGIFGQSGRPQSVLENAGVGVGDLFLFFGRFQEARRDGDALRFRTPKEEWESQALFGFLRVGKVMRAKIAKQEYRRFGDHPHLTDARLEWDETPGGKKYGFKNTVYFAAERLGIPGMDGYPGFGVFKHAPNLVLTATGHSPSFWDLPSYFDEQFCGRCITRIVECHCRKRCATKECRRKGLCSTGTQQWQESTVNATPEIQGWALERIRVGMGID